MDALLVLDHAHEVHHLDRQIIAVTTLMKVAKDKTDFQRLFALAYPKNPQTLLAFPVDDNDVSDDGNGKK